MLLYSSCKETLSCRNVSVFAEQEIDCQAMLINGAIEIRPVPSDFDVSLIYAPRSADRPRIATPVFLELRDIALNPS